jgi:two-component system KDP operon response regulator KdpE
MSPETFAVLIVAREPALRHFIRDLLNPTGFLLAEARSTQEAVDMACQKSYDVILVDLNVPDYGAADACRSLRALSPGIGIIVTRAKDEPVDEEALFEAGANDCIVAPFRFREIVARIGVILRRRPTAAPGLVRVHSGSLEIDLEQRRVSREGQDIHLSRREFDLLSALMANAGAAITHDRLAKSAWGKAKGNRAYLRTYIKALRQKLEEDPSNPQYILTQAWVGYRFRYPG